MAAAGGIIQAAMELVKEKERQGDKAMDRLHDGFKNQMQLTAGQGSWTSDAKPSQVVKEKETVKEKVNEPEEKEEAARLLRPLLQLLPRPLLRQRRRMRRITLQTWVFSALRREQVSKSFNFIIVITIWV